jgi:hypothetical protein
MLRTQFQEDPHLQPPQSRSRSAPTLPNIWILPSVTTERAAIRCLTKSSLLTSHLVEPYTSTLPAAQRNHMIPFPPWQGSQCPLPSPLKGATTSIQRLVTYRPPTMTILSSEQGAHPCTNNHTKSPFSWHHQPPPSSRKPTTSGNPPSNWVRANPSNPAARRSACPPPCAHELTAMQRRFPGCSMPRPSEQRLIASTRFCSCPSPVSPPQANERMHVPTASSDCAVQ